METSGTDVVTVVSSSPAGVVTVVVFTSSVVLTAPVVVSVTVETTLVWVPVIVKQRQFSCHGSTGTYVTSQLHIRNARPVQQMPQHESNKTSHLVLWTLLATLF